MRKTWKRKKIRGMTGPTLRSKYIEEPLLLFAEGYKHIDPKYGILAAGPKSYQPADKHPSELRIGLIGSAETMDQSEAWMSRGAAGIDGNKEHLRFPGFQRDRGFRSQLSFDSDWAAQLFQSEINEVFSCRERRQRFEMLLSLLDSKLNLLSQ